MGKRILLITALIAITACGGKAKDNPNHVVKAEKGGNCMTAGASMEMVDAAGHALPSISGEEVRAGKPMLYQLGVGSTNPKHIHHVAITAEDFRKLILNEGIVKQTVLDQTNHYHDIIINCDSYYP